ncbi:MAG TPA: GerMN domain-containing protein [Desulfuromonadales bacterium]|nr:GerMN domain-containing protein [Desulfuromonadales bacterium]
MKKLDTVHLVLIMAALVVAVAVVGFLLGRSSQPGEEKAPLLEQAGSSEAETQELTLYFAARDGNHLVAENRESPDCEKGDDCLRMAVEALLEGPEGPLGPVLPPSTALLAAGEEDGTAVLDFDRSFIDLHPGGSSSELVTVYGLIDTLAVNFPHIRKLRILVEGEEVETIKGHVDLRKPIMADFKYTRLPQDAGGDISSSEGK